MKEFWPDFSPLAVDGKKLESIREGKREFLKTQDGMKYEIRKGIVSFLGQEELTGNNKIFQKFYDQFALFYDAVTRFFSVIRGGGGVKKRLMQYLEKLNIPDGSRVIEISIGTGRNLRYLNPSASYYGVDISAGMLKRCRKTMKKLRRNIVLIQAEAENLPLKDESFDVVFSAGGFNFFNDKRKAVEEMLRIARKGSRIMISDETAKIQEEFRKSPGAGKFYTQEEIKNPVEFLPEYCQSVEYKEICNHELYVLAFVKP